MNFKRIYEEEQNAPAVIDQDKQQGNAAPASNQQAGATTEAQSDSKEFTPDQAREIVNWSGFVASEQKFCKNMNTSVTSIVNILNKGLQDKKITPKQKTYVTKCVEYGQVLQSLFTKMLESIGTKDQEGSLSNVVNKAAEVVKGENNQQDAIEDNSGNNQQGQVEGNGTSTPALEDKSQPQNQQNGNGNDDDENTAGKSLEQ